MGRLAEDWYGNYWSAGRSSEVYEENGYRFLRSYRAWCVEDADCLDMVEIRRTAEGWRWTHAGAAGEPHEHWQEAAAEAVANNVAKPWA